MDKIIAYCGLNCSECPAYLATQTGNRAELEQVAAQWREAFNMPDLTAESVVCDGCLQIEGGRLIGYCATCAVRACAVERGVANCAHCADYACDKLTAFWAHAPEARAALEQIRTGL
jgi:hypothetical protein